MVLRIIFVMCIENYFFIGPRIIFRGIANLFFGLQCIAGLVVEGDWFESFPHNDYMRQVDHIRGYWNPKRKLGVTTHFSEITVLQYGERRGTVNSIFSTKAFPLRSATCEAAISAIHPSNLVTVLFSSFVQQIKASDSQLKGHLYVLQRFKSIFWWIIS